jgi:hypothetical protein
MKQRLGLLSLGLVVSASSAAQNGLDAATVQKWKGATEIRWQATGVYQGREKVVFGDYPGHGDVRYTIAVEFTWRRVPRVEVADVTLSEGRTSVTNVRSDDTDCGPPVLKGDYEHLSAVKVRRADSGQITLDASRSYPAASVSQYPAGCGMMAIPGGTEPARIVSVGVPDATILAGPLTAQVGNISLAVAGDRQSFTMTRPDGWEWTYVPTLLK